MYHKLPQMSIPTPLFKDVGSGPLQISLLQVEDEVPFAVRIDAGLLIFLPCHSPLRVPTPFNKGCYGPEVPLAINPLADFYN